MASIEEIRDERLKKLSLLSEKGIDPYPAFSSRDRSIAELLADFESLQDKEVVTVAGRITGMRKHGASIFIDLYDGSGSVQGYLKKDALSEDLFEMFETTADVGDFIDIKGTPFITKKGEQSVLAESWNFLTKSLRPLPEKWHGLQDPDLKFRQRYLDMIMDQEVKKDFLSEVL